MQYFISIIILVLSGSLFLFFTVRILLDKIVEPAYAMVTDKPLYVHIYLKKRKVPSTVKQQLTTDLFYSRLTPKHQLYFEHRIACFLKKYSFHGNDIEVSGEMKVKLASVYVMLTFGMRNFLPNVFNKIVIFPAEFYSAANNAYHKGEFNPRMKAVVFSWKDFEKGNDNNSDNLNLGIHEFGHLLHYHGMRNRDISSSIFSDMYDSILTDLRKPGAIDRIREKQYFREYAYVNEFEFLAVVLEHFFESPKDFKLHFPQLFRKIEKMLNYKEPQELF